MPHKLIVKCSESLKKVLNRSTSKKAIQVTLIRNFGVLLQFALTMVLVRYLDKATFGVYALTMTVCGLVSLAGSFGAEGYLRAVVPKMIAEDRRGQLRSLAGSTISVSVVVSLIIVGGCWLYFVGATPSSDAGSEGSARLAWNWVFLAPLLALEASLSGFGQGLGCIVQTVAARDGFKRAVILLSVGALYVSSKGYGRADAVLWMHVIGSAITVGYLWFSMRTRLPKKSESSVSNAPGPWSLIGAALPFLSMAGGRLLNRQTDIIMLGILMNNEAVADYRIVVLCSLFFDIFSGAIATVIGPQLSAAFVKKDFDRIKLIVVSAHRASLVAYFLMLLGVVLIGEFFLKKAFGADYGGGIVPLTTLAIGRLVYSVCCFSGVALSMFGLARVSAALTFAAVLCNVVLNLALIPLHGINGAAIATASSGALIAGISVIYIYKKFGLNLSCFGRMS